MADVTLPPIPHRVPVIDKNGMVTQPWSKWFLFIFERAGGVIAPSLGDTDVAVIQAEVDQLQIDVDAAESDITVLQATVADHETRIDALEGGGDNVFELYQVNEIDDVGGGVTIIGKAKPDGTWLLEKLTESAGDISKVYANESNNVGTTTFTTAWTNRASLTYGQIQTLTGL